MLLRLFCLVVISVHISCQDLVTLAPGEATESSATAEKIKLKPKIRSFQVTSDIKYRYATTVVSTRVVNTNSEAGEAVFSLTLPESAFISQFLMEIKDKVYKAYVKEKAEAKAVYDEAVSAGQFAGHVALDARDSNSFTVSVNIEPHGKVTFNLTYEQLLSRNLGVYKNVININPNEIVDDMSVTVNIEEPTEIVHLEVPEIQETNDIVDVVKENKIARVEVFSPTHKQVIWKPSPEEQKLQRASGVKGQFIVKYDVAREDNPQQILVDEGYFVHFFAPENLPKLKKHVVFVLDYSGSMYGQKLSQLKDAMKKILSDLESTDYFSIVIFHSIVKAWSPNHTYTDEERPDYWRDEPSDNSTTTILNKEFVVEATKQNVDSAFNFLNKLSDLGSTNIMGGLRMGLQLVDIGHSLLNEKKIHPLLIFLTDGQPNVEVADTDEIIKRTKTLNSKECPVFSLAFGSGADSKFLRKLSLLNHGLARTIYEAADASSQLKNFYHTIASPLLANVTFSYLPGQVDNSSSTKQDFPVFFRGSEIVVAGRFNEEAAGTQTAIGELCGVSAQGIETYPIVIGQLPLRKNHSVGHLEKTWAYLTIQQLLDKSDSLDQGSDKNLTQAKALELALKYSLVTPLTSLVVVKPNETESAVDTEKLTPGLQDSLYIQPLMGGSNSYAPQSFAAAYYPQPLSGQPRPAPASPLFSTRIAYDTSSGYNSMSQQAVDFRVSYENVLDLTRPIDDAFEATTQELSNSDTTQAPPARKVALNDLTWLLPHNTTVTVNNKEYIVGLNQTDTIFGNCTVSGKSEEGECRHIQYCALAIFKDSFNDFVSYVCPIIGNYLGVCCPAVLQ